MQHNLKLIYLLIGFGLKDVNDSLTRFFADFMITGCRFGVMLFLYYALFQYKGGSISGIDFQIAAWSMYFYFVFDFIAPRSLSSNIQSDIQTGKVEVLLSKPISYLYYKLGEYLGHRISLFVISTFFGTILLSIFVGVPTSILTWLFASTFPLVIICCFILTFEIYAIIGLLAFWVEDIASFRWLLDKGAMILGGAYFPVALFPEILKYISLYSPIGASRFTSYVAYASWSQDYLWMLGLQIFWIIIIGLILYWLQKKSFHKLNVNGG